MSSLTPLEKNKIEKLFEMGGGYVLNFNNKSFSQFFNDTVSISIDDKKYFLIGGSKADRLRAFWKLESDELVGKTLSQMLEHWKFFYKDKISSEKDLTNECELIVARLLKKIHSEQSTEEDFLRKEFPNISLANIHMEAGLLPIMESRLQEVHQCMQINASLSAIILCGSILEGLLLGIASQNPAQFNKANSSPKDRQGSVKQFQNWTLENFINVAHEIGFLSLDVKDYGLVLRKFRNFIHPFQQLTEQFSPDKHTARISLQVLKTAIADLSGERKLSATLTSTSK